LVLEMSFALREQRQEIQSQALDSATEVSNLVDGRLQADLSAMRVLATAQTALTRNWPGFIDRARQVAALNPGWKAVIVSDLASGRQLLDTSLATPMAPAAMQHRYLGPAKSPARISGSFRGGGPCPCVALNAPLGGDPNLIMTVLIDTDVFQDILKAHIADIPVSAVVDRDGFFIARFPSYADRVGTPGSVSLRDAVRAGGEGVYRGKTLEGLANYTAYHTSPLSGWSAHMAVAAGNVDQPLAWNNRVRIGGAVLGLLLAAGLVALALNELAMRRREEESLRQTQKLEALGRLTGGVAHDFNNLLTVIIGALDMLMTRVEEPRAHRLAERALEAARRGARLTGQLLTFSRSQRLQVSSVDVARLIDEMDDLLRQSAGPAANLKVQITERPLFASTDASQLEFAILNLVLNARDAMPDGGDLIIEAGPGPTAGQIVVSVSDTGHGMERAVVDRALEPFFSTKAPDKGTGLGLAQVYGAVRQSGGDIAIESAPGKGAKVRLFLPRAAPNPVELETAPTAHGESRTAA
jgi:signal transduction histidine kinase